MAVVLEEVLARLLVGAEAAAPAVHQRQWHQQRHQQRHQAVDQVDRQRGRPCPAGGQVTSVDAGEVGWGRPAPLISAHDRRVLLGDGI